MKPFLFWIAILISYGTVSYAQNSKINLDLKDVTIQNAISSIENQSEYYFLYSPKMVNVNQKVSIHVTGEIISNVLYNLFAGTGIKYTIRDRQILLVNNDIDLTTLMQKNRIIGTVTDNHGNPVPGASVVVKGTSSGTFTESNGKYTLNNLSQNAVLVFSFVGMTSQEIPLNGHTVLDVVMIEQAVGLGEVVVTALGLQTERRALGYNTSSVKSVDILAGHSVNFSDALQGKISGAKISSFTAKPGSALQIVLRGGSSITGNNEPLFVVNGIPFDAANLEWSTGLNDIDPNSIESVDVLSGAAASALYGSKAANGVILITTKTGTFDSKPAITISHSSSFDNAIFPKRNTRWAQGVWDQDQQKYVYYDGETQFTPFSYGPLISDVPGAKTYDTYKMGIFKTAYTYDNSISLSGGGKNASYYVSYSGLNDNGVVPEQLNFARQSFSANTSFKFTDKLTVSTNITYTKQGGLQAPEGWQNIHFMNTFLMEPLTWNPYPLNDENGNPRSYRGGGRDPWLWIRDYFKRDEQRTRTFGTLIVEYKFNDHFKFKSTTGLSSAYNLETWTTDWGGVFTTKESSGVTWNTNNRSDLESTNLLLYNTKVGNLKIDAFIGHDIVSNTQKTMSAGGGPLIIPHIFMISNLGTVTGNTSLQQMRSWSLMGELRVAYKDMLYFNVTGRNDWPSTLNNSYFYSSESLGFVFSELLQDKSILNFGKARISYSKVGAPAVPYANNETLTGPRSAFVYWPFNGQQSYLPSATYPNPDLTNEDKNEVEWGLSLQFFRNRVGLEFTQYHAWSTNQIVVSPLLPETGYTGGNINIGGITHWGTELQITGTPVRRSEFSWDITLNWQQDKSRVDKLGSNDQPIMVGWEGAAVVGQPYPVIYGEAMLHDDKGNLVKSDMGDQTNRVLYGDYMLDPTGNKSIAKIMPDWTGGLKNTFTYKRISLSALFTAQMGGHVYSLLSGFFTRFGMADWQNNRPADNRLVLPGVMGHFDYNTGKVVVTDPNPNNDVWTRFENHCVNDYWNDEKCSEPTDFIRLKEVSLSYDLPTAVARKILMKGARVSFSGRNLWRKFSRDFHSMDPEFVTSSDNYFLSNPSPVLGNAAAIYGFPPNKTYTISVSLTF